MSTNKSFLGWGPKDDGTPGDEKLLRHLWTHGHHTPFEFGGLTLEVQAPIFVFREWHRHRTQSYNEMSARYTPLPDVNYVPTIPRCIPTPSKNKQNQGAVARTPTTSEIDGWLEDLESVYRHSQDVYQSGLALGLPKEVARLAVNVGRYSRMRASANLRNWLHFLSLRQSPDAQWEIRQFANVVGTIVAEHFPRTWALFEETR
jgi:thymidylate synthase (FAD)